MNIFENKAIKNNKRNNTEKKERKIIYNTIKNKNFSSKNMYPHDSSYNANINPFNISNNEENVIANILKTNNVKSETFQNLEKEKINSNIKYINKNSSTSVNINVDKEYKEKGDFNFINISQKVKPFLYKPKNTKKYPTNSYNNNFHFLDILNTFRMIINILIDDDSLNSSNNLLKIFESIILSLNSLGEINISNKDFIICIFFQHISNEGTFKDIFPQLNFYNCNNWNLKMNSYYCSYGSVISVNETPINVLLFYKEKATYVEIYKFFYCNILNDLITLLNADSKDIGKTFLVVNWPNGKIYEKSSNKYHKSRILSNIFRICNNRNMILIPDINYSPYNNVDYFGYIQKYNFDSDKVHINLLWDMMCEYPIDHRFFFINMNFKLYLILKDFYQNKISIYSNEFYHDYLLSIYLKRQTKNIVIQKIQQVKIEYNNLPLNLIDFFLYFTLKRGSEYANVFSLICYFFSWRNMSFLKFLQKFVLVFKLINFLVEFFWLGLSLLISYAVFNETFGTEDNKVDYFCSLGYAIIVILLLFISSIYIKNKPKKKCNIIYRNVKRNKESFVILLVLYIVHYVYNIFFIVCSIIAIIHVENGKNKEYDNKNFYIFQKDYFLLLLLLNILFVILPSFIRPSNIISFGFLLYLVLQFPNATCFFHIPYLFTSIRNINSENKSSEYLYISLYIILNGLLTVMCLVFDTKRQRRMDFFYVLASILVILNGVKFIILLVGICWQNRFNKEISTGQIPQYNIVNSEYDNNINDKKNNIINNSNNKMIKVDNIGLSKNGSNLTIKYINERKIFEENNNQELKIRTGYEKECSSQVSIIPNNNLMLNKSIEQNNKKDDIQNQTSNKHHERNDSNLHFSENDNQLNSIDIRKTLDSHINYQNKSSIHNKNEQELYINNINPIYNRNDTKDLEIHYPFDSEKINEDNRNNNYKYIYEENNYEDKYENNYENNYENINNANNKYYENINYNKEEVN